MKRFLISNVTTSKKSREDLTNVTIDSGTSTNQSTTEMDKLKNHYLFDGKVYKVISIVENKLIAECQLCKKTIHGQVNSTGNFLSHVKVGKLNYINKFDLKSI